MTDPIKNNLPCTVCGAQAFEWGDIASYRSGLGFFPEDIPEDVRPIIGGAYPIRRARLCKTCYNVQIFADSKQVFA